ncbi:MAG: SHOCT domain-containing protein [Acidothermus cellulolyticus]|nr:SHOCT domain-containing protein [Acidothermus cellulolyticus]
MMDWDTGPGWGGPTWAGWLGMSLMMALAVALIVAVVMWLTRMLSSAPEARREQPGDALRILDERFARGELDEETYQRQRALLTRR